MGTESCVELSSEGSDERANLRDAVGVSLALAGGEEVGGALLLLLLLLFRAAVEVAREEVAAVVEGDVLVDVVAGGGGCVVITAGAAAVAVVSAGGACAWFSSAFPAPDPAEARRALSPALSEHNIEPILVGSVANSTPGNTLSKLSPRGWVPAVSLKRWQRMSLSAMVTSSPLLTWIETPFWEEEASKRVLKGTVRVVEVSSFVVARTRVTVPWHRTVGVKKGRRMRRRRWGGCGSFILGMRRVGSKLKENS